MPYPDASASIGSQWRQRTGAGSRPSQCTVGPGNGSDGDAGAAEHPSARTALGARESNGGNAPDGTGWQRSERDGNGKRRRHRTGRVRLPVGVQRKAVAAVERYQRAAGRWIGLQWMPRNGSTARHGTGRHDHGYQDTASAVEQGDGKESPHRCPMDAHQWQQSRAMARRVRAGRVTHRRHRMARRMHAGQRSASDGIGGRAMACRGKLGFVTPRRACTAVESKHRRALHCQPWGAAAGNAMQSNALGCNGPAVTHWIVGQWSGLVGNGVPGKAAAAKD